MATDADFVKFIVDQLAGIDSISCRKMFGEYAMYCDGKVVALVCDNQLFVKPTKGGRDFVGEIAEAPPYPGAKLCFLIEDKLEDQEWMQNLITITANELPVP
ncbi:MAG: TfoX/Sxy family protein, partial [Methyloglobulus sp.]|nr:TfoX/Sxy family protein [Methyloglobulus sp.]